MAKPKAFNTYIDNIDKLEMLSDEQAGRLYKALCKYASDGIKPDFSDDPLLSYAYVDFAQKIERDFERYAKTCEKRKECGKLGGAPVRNENAKKQANQPKGYSCEEKQQNGYQNNQNNQKVFKTTKTTQKEKEKEEEEEYKKENTKEKRDNAFFERVKDEFNSVCVSLPTVKLLTDTRKRRIHKARSTLKDVSFTDFFKRVEKSDFLTGKETEWRASFDWIFKPENLTKILEGNYDNKPNKRGSVYSANGASFDVSKFEDSGLFD